MRERRYGRRSREADEHDAMDRWLVSYSDFLTLMFTFFAALYALSSVDHDKVGKFSSSLREAFKVIDYPVQVVEDGSRPILADLRRALAETEGITVKGDPRGIALTLSNDTAFVTGSADLQTGAAGALESIAAVLRKYPGRIVVEGHTDNVAIAGRYRTNWELSTARAASVLHLLIERGRIEPDRMTIAGYGEFRPVASNESPDGRARNRRVEIVLVPVR